jgi:hypothetical protein
MCGVSYDICDKKKLLKDFWLDIYLATAKYQFLVNEKYVIILRKPKL